MIQAPKAWELKILGCPFASMHDVGGCPVLRNVKEKQLPGPPVELFFVECDACGARGPVLGNPWGPRFNADFKEKAIRAWNRRTTTQ